MSLPFSLIRLFESGVLDRMTNEEYDKMYQKSKKTIAETQQTPKDVQMTEEVALKKLNLRTLKGAFLVLLMGYALSLVAFVFEKLQIDCRVLGRGFKSIIIGCHFGCKRVLSVFWNTIIRNLIKLIMFKYKWN